MPQRKLDGRWGDIAVVPTAREHQRPGCNDGDPAHELIGEHRRKEQISRALETRAESPVKEIEHERDERWKRQDEPHAAEALDLFHRERHAHQSDDHQRTEQRDAGCRDRPAEASRELRPSRRRGHLVPGGDQNQQGRRREEQRAGESNSRTRKGVVVREQAAEVERNGQRRTRSQRYCGDTIRRTRATG